MKISLLEAYLKKDFFFFKKKNPSEIINNIRGEAPQLALNVINSSLDIVIDIFLILFIYSFLIILNPTAILSITLLLLLFLFCIKFFFTKKLNYLGKERLKNDIQQTILINESIYGIRDLILYNFEKNLLKVFKKKISQTIIPQYKSLLISASPKLILETLSISFLLIFIILFGVSNITINQIGFLSITFYAFIKLVPNVLSIVRNYQSITFYYPSAKKIINLIKEKNQVRQYKNISNYHKDFFIENIYLKNVTFKYLNHTVIKKVNLEINKKDKILIIGKSGSGKSTLLDILSGLIVPDSGHVLVNNELLNKKNLQKYRNKLSYASQENFIFSGNILNNFKFDDNQIGKNSNDKNLKDQIKKIFFKINLNFIKLSSKTEIKERGLNFSGGEKQRIALARALFKKKAEIILIDEPTNFLDKYNADRIILNILKMFKDKIVICVTHDENIYKYFDKKFMLKNQKLIAI